MGNRIIAALQQLGGSGTTQDITRVVRANPESISGQIAGMLKRGDVKRAGTKVIHFRRYNRMVRVTATIWELV